MQFEMSVEMYAGGGICLSQLRPLLAGRVKKSQSKSQNSQNSQITEIISVSDNAAMLLTA